MRSVWTMKDGDFVALRNGVEMRVSKDRRAAGWLAFAHGSRIDGRFDDHAVARYACERWVDDMVRCDEPDAATPRPVAEWSESDGDVLGWRWTGDGWADEAPYVGSPLDLGHEVEVRVRSDAEDNGISVNAGGWPGYHTHWTPLPPRPAHPEGSADD